MSTNKKNTTKKSLKKRGETVIVVERSIASKDTLFPDKVAKANKILQHTKFHDPGFFA
jgi:hypothetical protein